jgi:hypothetical protein
MTPDQFTQALDRLGWKQADLCRKASLDKKTPSRWATGAVPIPEWVPTYLGLLEDVKALHAKYLDPKTEPSIK